MSKSPQQQRLVMTTCWDTIYLSPHLDDAILSCGGQIYDETCNGKSILVVTVAAGDPPEGNLTGYSHSLHQRWQLATTDVVAVRRDEDVAACAVVGASVLHWEVPDCIYRRHPTTGQALYISDDAIFGDIHPAEADLVDQLAQKMGDLPAHNSIIVPLTVGHHVDHQLTRLAAERWFNPGLHSYYEDYPYARDDRAVTAALSSDSQWHSRVFPISKQALAAKIRAINCYRSQLSTFFRDQKDMARQVRDMALLRGGERLWHRSSISK